MPEPMTAQLDLRVWSQAINSGQYGLSTDGRREDVSREIERRVIALVAGVLGVAAERVSAESEWFTSERPCPALVGRQREDQCGEPTTLRSVVGRPYLACADRHETPVEERAT
ncbi:hypothetical protein LCGC14_1732940 [marine sediment metagenome]|uniref:Uncharacterized protein n=1 Tax=marine sediment metagenome TaxID=412755 RepID=A0A0F9H8T2_9ZZZZ